MSPEWLETGRTDIKELSLATRESHMLSGTTPRQPGGTMGGDRPIKASPGIFFPSSLIYFTRRGSVLLLFSNRGHLALTGTWLEVAGRLR